MVSPQLGDRRGDWPQESCHRRASCFSGVWLCAVGWTARGSLARFCRPPHPATNAPKNELEPSPRGKRGVGSHIIEPVASDLVVPERSVSVLRQPCTHPSTEMATPLRECWTGNQIWLTAPRPVRWLRQGGRSTDAILTAAAPQLALDTPPHHTT